jgi:hypothetical protein
MAVRRKTSKKKIAKKRRVTKNAKGTKGNPILQEIVPLSEDELKRMGGKAATTYCSGVVASTAAGNWCNSSECANLVGKTHYYKCDGETCPIKNGKWYWWSGACPGGGTQMYVSACKVMYRNVTACS